MVAANVIEATRESFVEAAFALVPENVEPPYPDQKVLATIPVTARAEVLVVERIGFAPAVQADYESPGEDRPSGRSEILAALEALRNYQEMVDWFAIDQIIERIEFKMREAATQPASEEPETVDSPAVTAPVEPDSQTDSTG